MNRAVLHLLVFSLVWLSAYAAADRGALGHAHQAEVVQIESSDALADAVSDPQHSQDGGGHCERCCHAHASVMPTLPAAADNAYQPGFVRAADAAWHKGTPPPPIPPPIV